MMARPAALDGYHVVMCITNKHQLKGHAAWWVECRCPGATNPLECLGFDVQRAGPGDHAQPLQQNGILTLNLSILHCRQQPRGSISSF